MLLKHVNVQGRGKSTKATTQASRVQDSDERAALGLALLLFFGFFEKFAEFRNCGHVG
jgi:hypothetical protein